jgi:SAM-dependent methyltransferase
VDSPSRCRLCGGSRLTSLGEIPASDFFAGRVLPRAIPGGCLWRCDQCESLFRHPILPSAAYRQLYESGAPDQWSDTGGRLDLQAVKSVVLAHPGAVRCLDVGCGTGDFLMSLPSAMSKFGVEPSAGAAQKAKGRGIEIVAPTLEELPAGVRFDVITIIDVIEHLPNPDLLLEQARAHLTDGGLIVLSTGDPHNAWWRERFRSRFWYSSFPEHISFPSRRFYERWAADRGAEVVGTLSTRYRQLPFWKRAVYFVIQMVYQVSPPLLDWVGRILDLLARRPVPRRQHFAPGVSGLLVDHWVVAIRVAEARRGRD